jgi:hypothetical protein
MNEVDRLFNIMNISAKQNAALINPNLRVIKFIGKGVNGYVYLVKYNKYYAMKIQKILEKDLIDNSSQIYREIEFAKTMYTLYPRHFMKLYKHKINKKCMIEPYSRPPDLILDKIGNDHEKYIYLQYMKQKSKKLNNSSICCVNLWSTVDITMSQWIKKYKSEYTKIYDLFVQYLYIVYLIQINNYSHNDLHLDNLGMNKTSKKSIKILGNRINTHGYYIVAIDYDRIVSNKYSLNDNDMRILKNESDLIDFFNSLIIIYYLDFSAEYPDEDMYEAPSIKPSHEKYLQKYINRNIFSSDVMYNQMLSAIYKIVYYKKYQKFILGNTFTEPVKLTKYIPRHVSLHIAKNYYNIENGLGYMITYRPRDINI